MFIIWSGADKVLESSTARSLIKGWEQMANWPYSGTHPIGVQEWNWTLVGIYGPSICMVQCCQVTK